MSYGWPTDKTTRIRITAEEGAARSAEISYQAVDDTLDLEALIGGKVGVTFTGFANGVASGSTLFTGTVISAAYSLADDEVTLTCTDGLQQVVNAMTREQIEALVPGVWHPALYGDEKPEGWDYLQMLLESAPGTVELDAQGHVRYTPWNGSGASMTIGTDSMVCDRQNVSASRAFSSPVNKVLIRLSHRYELFRGAVTRYQYDYGDVCQWHNNSKRMMPYRMVTDAIAKDGRLVRGFSAKFLEPPGSVCGGIIWLGDKFFKLVRAFGVVLEDRWSQQVTEKIEVAVANAASVAKYGENADSIDVALDIEADVEAWTDDPGRVVDPEAIGPEIGSALNPDIGETVYAGVDDVASVAASELGAAAANMGDYDAVNAALAAAVAVAKNRIRGSHRIGRVTATTKLNPFVDVDKSATIDAGRVSASGKIGQVVFDIDVKSCRADMTVTLFTSVAQGGVDTDPAPIAAPGDDEYPACSGSSDITLSTVTNGGEEPPDTLNGLWFSGEQTSDDSVMKLCLVNDGAGDDCTQHWEHRRVDQDQVVGVAI